MLAQQKNSCPDCGGSGKYIGLLEVEPCKSCQSISDPLLVHRKQVWITATRQEIPLRLLSSDHLQNTINCFMGRRAAKAMGKHVDKYKCAGLKELLEEQKRRAFLGA